MTFRCYESPNFGVPRDFTRGFEECYTEIRPHSDASYIRIPRDYLLDKMLILSSVLPYEAPCAGVTWSIKQFGSVKIDFSLPNAVRKALHEGLVKEYVVMMEFNQCNLGPAATPPETLLTLNNIDHAAVAPGIYDLTVVLQRAIRQSQANEHRLTIDYLLSETKYEFKLALYKAERPERWQWPGINLNEFRITNLPRGYEYMDWHFELDYAFSDENKILVDLMCPLSDDRVMLPGRGIQCRHLEVFDVHYYVYNSRLTQNWVCPIPGCNREVRFFELRVDRLFEEIIHGLLDEEIPATIIEFGADMTWKYIKPDPSTVSAANNMKGNKRMRKHDTDPALSITTKQPMRKLSGVSYV
ncbi:unnamed protein product, partial [Mesorhabditis spiculigera]